MTDTPKFPDVLPILPIVYNNPPVEPPKVVIASGDFFNRITGAPPVPPHNPRINKQKH